MRFSPSSYRCCCEADSTQACPLQEALQEGTSSQCTMQRSLLCETLCPGHLMTKWRLITPPGFGTRLEAIRRLCSNTIQLLDPEHQALPCQVSPELRARLQSLLLFPYLLPPPLQAPLTLHFWEGRQPRMGHFWEGQQPQMGLWVLKELVTAETVFPAQEVRPRDHAVTEDARCRINVGNRSPWTVTNNTLSGRINVGNRSPWTVTNNAFIGSRSWTVTRVWSHRDVALANRPADQGGHPERPKLLQCCGGTPLPTPQSTRVLLCRDAGMFSGPSDTAKAAACWFRAVLPACSTHQASLAFATRRRQLRGPWRVPQRLLRISQAGARGWSLTPTSRRAWGPWPWSTPPPTSDGMRRLQLSSLLPLSQLSTAGWATSSPAGPA